MISFSDRSIPYSCGATGSRSRARACQFFRPESVEDPPPRLTQVKEQLGTLVQLAQLPRRARFAGRRIFGCRTTVDRRRPTAVLGEDGLEERPTAHVKVSDTIQILVKEGIAYLCRASYLSESYSSDTRDGSNFSRLTSHQSPKRPSHRSRKHPHQRSVLDFEKESKEAYRGRGTGTRRSTTAAESSRLAACPNSRASWRAASSSARSSPSPPNHSHVCRSVSSLTE